MPYEIKGNCVIKSDTGEIVKCHASKSEAEAHLAALMANVEDAHNAMTRQAIRYIEKFDYKPGQPFRIMPIGTFKRGERTLDITADDLNQMVTNYTENRPRWKIPIYAGHPTDAQPDPPKVGNVAKLEVHPDGLYAVPEWTPEGEQLAASGYQYVSPGVLWSKNGGGYTDEHGQTFDNTLEHIALTNRPYFGNKTQLFSADTALIESMADMPMADMSKMLNACIQSCNACIEICQKQPKQDSVMECIAACKECIAACKACLASPSDTAVYEKCASICGKCQAACLQCAIDCPPCQEICIKCASACTDCGAMCDQMTEKMTVEANGETFRWVTVRGRHIEIADEGEANAGQMVGGKPGDNIPAVGPGFKSARHEFDFVNKRLAAGDLKKGERRALEARAENLAKKILDVKETATVWNDNPEIFKDYSIETRREMAKKGEALPDGSYPIADGGDLMDAIHRLGSGNIPEAKIKAHIIKRAKNLGMTDKLPAEWMRAVDQSTEQLTADGLDTNKTNLKGVLTMPESTVPQTPPAPGTFSVKAEEFAALKEKAAKVEKLEADMKEANTKAEKFAADLMAVNRARRHDQLVAHAEQFIALPVKAAEIADKLQALEEKDPDLFKYFDDLLGTVNATVAAGDLFAQKSSAMTGKPGANSFAAKVQAKLVEKFNGDPVKYGEAMKIVSLENPDLAAAYARGQEA